MENYEEKYKKALSYVKGLIEHNVVSQENASKYFSELAESEDENIRKGLIQYFSTFSLDTFAGLAPKKIIAWLEKQKPIELDKDAEIRFRSILNLIDNGCPIEKSYIDFIKSVYVMLMKSQQQKTSENDYLKKQGEQKPAWSEEDDKKRKGLIKGLEDRMGFGWASDPFSREEYIDWLKSLKDRYIPQSHWKPSVEQMKRLRNAIGICKGVNEHTDAQHLEKLFNELQKLM